MLVAARLKPEAKNLLWSEAYLTANLIMNVTGTNANHVPPSQRCTDKPPRIIHHLREIGRIGTVAHRKKMQGKYKKKATKMILVGSAPYHTKDTYRFSNPKTKFIVTSRDITWIDWERHSPNYNMSIFKLHPELKKGGDKDY